MQGNYLTLDTGDKCPLEFKLEYLNDFRVIVAVSDISDWFNKATVLQWIVDICFRKISY